MVDEALKRFQAALKLHARGQKSRKAASAAYQELFESEIFRYREAKTDYDRAERHDAARLDTFAADNFSTALDVDAGGADGVAASLSQALYMSYKNYGQFFLDQLKDRCESDPDWAKELRIRYHDHDSDKVLDNWTAALDQDPSDPELWRKTARFAGAMNSGRIKRYCLEAAIELDDDPAVAEVAPPSLAEGFAGQQLKEHLQLLDDDVSLSHPIIKPWLKREMPALLLRQLDPLPFLPDPSALLTPPSSCHDYGNKDEDEKKIDVAYLSAKGGESSPQAAKSWTELGVELMRCIQDTKGALQACRSILDAAHQDAKTGFQTEQESEPVTQPEPEPECENKPPNLKPDTDIKAEERVRQTDEDPPIVRRSTRQGSKANARAKVETRPDAPVNGLKESVMEVDQESQERCTSALIRKRSQSAAGLLEGADEGNVAEKRSKRARRRTEAALSEEAKDSYTSASVSFHIMPFHDCDRNLFELTKNILESIGVEDRATMFYWEELLESCDTNDRLSKLSHPGAKDLSHVLSNFDEDLANVLLNKNEQPTLGLSSFLEHTKSSSQDQDNISPLDEAEGLEDFSETVLDGAQWLTSDDIAFEWVRAMSQSYTVSKWPDTLKVAVVQMLNRADSVLYTRITEFLSIPTVSEVELNRLGDILPMLFELHIDIYQRITNPSSAVDYATRVETKYRLDRWMETMSMYVELRELPQKDPLCVRFMWASVMASSLTDNPVREHILLLWTSLRDFMVNQDVETINLPNNAVMPVISPAAADRELSKLTTMDFFLGLFQDEMNDPVSVIDTLEPVLNPTSVFLAEPAPSVPVGESGRDNDSQSTNDSAEAESEGQSSKSEDGSTSSQELAINPKPISESATQGMKDLWKFLFNSSTELRLFLWSRLGDAYEAIGYPTKQFSCLLKSIEMMINDLEAEAYTKTPDESRKHLFMRTLKSLDELIIQALSMSLNEQTAFDIIDDEHLKSSSAAIARISAMLHVTTLCEDEGRIGIAALPTGNANFMTLISKLRDMQVRTWCLLFTVFRAGLSQRKEACPETQLAKYLDGVHRVLGLRKFCKSSNKILLKVMRVELLKSKKFDDWIDYLEQVLYDLFGLKLGVGAWEVTDHACPTEKLEKRQAMQLVEKVMILANRTKMKDLLKSDLKATIDHMQQAIGQTKSTPQMIHNLRNFTEMLKKPIHPLRLYQALSGNVSVDAVSVNMPETALARHGWFFLLGMIALTKFKGVDLNRRQTPGATDDLRIGATFLRLQLQFTADRWDAWFRLAECFDYELDEAVLWTADKMNKERSELVKYQRNAIHCYTLALSHSRHEQVGTNDGDPLHDLYHKFGLRLYSSSREPFAMEPFQHSDQERFFIEDMGAGTFKRILHDQMSEYKVWKLAARLFRMAMERNPRNWKNPYMLAKCYWKMYQTPSDRLDNTDRKAAITMTSLLDILKKSIKVSHSARRSRNSDPILEPHYKLVSILHKLVTRKDILPAKAASILAEQPFGVVVSSDDHFASFSEPEDWEEYIVKNLNKLREKDKSNWQHRIVMRHAKILFDESIIGMESDGFVEAKAAFALLKENMFTKTMVMNVWKCDAERPGRHHVYTEQYVRFMTNLMVIMSDRTNVELLLRRLRKRGADFYHFTDLWQYSCTAYVRLLRTAYKVPVTTDEAFKHMSNEEFEIMSHRITEWAGGEGQPNAAFECMKEAIEVKKLNGNLMKVAPIDDLINDCYTTIYKEVAGTLPGLEPGKIIEERNHAKEVAAQLEAAAQAESKTPKSLINLLNPPSGGDSAAGTATPMETDKAEVVPRAKRLAGVRRPEVLRKAEQAVMRALEAPKSGANRVGSMSSTKRGSHTPARAGSKHSSDDDDDDDDDDEPNGQGRRQTRHGADEQMKETDGDENAVDYSRLDDKDEYGHGSIHDSADESDLSDVPEGYDEDVPPGLLFPNLGHSRVSSDDEADNEEIIEEEDQVGEEEEAEHAEREDYDSTANEIQVGHEEDMEDEVDVGDEGAEEERVTHEDTEMADADAEEEEDEDEDEEEDEDDEDGDEIEEDEDDEEVNEEVGEEVRVGVGEVEDGVEEEEAEEEEDEEEEEEEGEEEEGEEEEEGDEDEEDEDGVEGDAEEEGSEEGEEGEEGEEAHEEVEEDDDEEGEEGDEDEDNEPEEETGEEEGEEEADDEAGEEEQA
ncbi:hypothetical protein UVI_02053000 [Ustilaginoidea virens]|uniref:Histone transcription regulator 3 homolog n=1 Tax=Ustilaginoidea virens TaxID=1159556 RepID=A0A1B5L571_USTVR|nr:hypothetical protein UVI_02053000 [Ustilaginoidea virens]